MLGFNGNISRNRGVSLTETLIAVAIISVAFLAVINTFGTISKSIQVSKAKTLATNLAQEKLQILRQLQYLRLMVTPLPAYRTDFTPNIPYDNTYYTPETIIEGGVEFTRLTYVQMATEVGNDLVYMGSSPDTGIKAITCTVIWEQDGNKRMTQLRTIYSNPNTVRTNAEFKGVVKSTSNVAISGASVIIAENMAWQDITGSTGAYSISCYDGNYTLVATKRGFFSKSIFKSIGPYQVLTQDFNLMAMSSGTVTGNVWLKDHFVISMVVASSVTVDGFDQEFIELYNPTTSYIGGPGYPEVEFVYQKAGDPEQIMQLSMDVADSTCAPNSFFLIANTSTLHVMGQVIQADAYYDTLDDGLGTPIYGADIIKSPDAGGVGARFVDALSGVKTWIDRVGWTHNPGMGINYPDIREGTAINGWGADDGFSPNEQYVRMSAPGSLSPSFGRAYDSDSNQYNFFDFTDMAYRPYTKYHTYIPLTGTPATGALVSCDDGLSMPTTAKLKGFFPYAEFQLTEVSTGTWRVMISSNVSNNFRKGPLSMEISTVTVTVNGQNVPIPSSNTVPTWPYWYYYSTFLTSEPAGGYIGGRVTNAMGLPINPNIVVTIGGARGTANLTDGRYFIPVGTGTMNVTANPTNDPLYNPMYVTQTDENIFVDFGLVVSTVDFRLSQGGRVSGKVTRDGINPLPNVSVVALNSAGAMRGDNVSASDGKFTIINLATGTYTIQPVLDSGEKSIPVTQNALVTAGANIFVGTFTITGAFGSITGTVDLAGKPISTGVLLIASTASFTAPPDMSSYTLTGCPYYFTNSYEDGTYRLEVRGSTYAAFNVNAYYPSVDKLTTVINMKSKSGIWVTPGAETTGQNFSW